MEDKNSPDAQIKPTLIFSVLCDDVRREDNGKFILIGLFEVIGAKSFPVIHPTLFIMNCWGAGIGEFNQKTRILNPEGHVLVEDRETVFQLQDMRAKHRIISRFNSIKFDKPGEYAVEVIGNGDLKLRYPLMVREA